MSNIYFNDRTYDRVPLEEVPNTSWMCNCFLLPKEAIKDLDRERRLFSTADRKFGDCSMGGGRVLNQPPGFTANADIPSGFGMDGKFGQGYGPCYSEAIDDNLDIIHIRPGMAEYNALTNFYTYMYDSEAGNLANRGVIGTLGAIVGTVAGLIVAAPVVAYIKLGRFIRWVQNKPYSAYYYLSPTSDLFWNALNQSVNMFATKAGLIPGVETDKWINGRPELSDRGLTENEIAAFNQLLPEVYRNSDVGGIDIFAVATRYKRLEMAYHKRVSQIQENSSDYNTLLQEVGGIDPTQLQQDGYADITSLIGAYANTAIAQGASQATENTSTEGGWGFDEYEASFVDHFEAQLKAGGQYVSLAVNYIGETSISVNNNTGESPVAETINGIVSSSRNVKHTMAGGNIGDNVVANTAEAVIGAGKDAVSSFADTIGLSFINAMAGNGFVDIPNIWQDSTSEMPKHSYTIEFNSASAHPMSKLQNIYIPILALMTLAFPLSTGSKSYTSPFLLELHHKGKNKISLGMMANLQIQLGDGEPGSWDFQEFPNHATATFDIINLSNKIHVPIAASSTSFMDDPNNFTDFLDVMASLGLHDQEK